MWAAIQTVVAWAIVTGAAVCMGSLLWLVAGGCVRLDLPALVACSVLQTGIARERRLNCWGPGWSPNRPNAS